jgi:hypothetical protein
LTPLERQRKTSVVTVVFDRLVPWAQTVDDELTPVHGLVNSQTTYRQVTLPVSKPAVSSPIAASEILREHMCKIRSMTALREWTQRLGRRLVAAGQIPRAALGPDSQSGEPIKVPPQYAEVVAQAFERHLVAGGEFKYSLVLQRHDERLDPVEDFVINTKVGHCNRFATALVLMLRSVGVPSRIVLGYSGYETDGSGTYEIRQCHAHSWVEALIQRPTSGGHTWHWLTLDPTPSSDDAASEGFSFGEWFESARNTLATFFRYFIVEYDADQQGRARTWLSRFDWSGVSRFALGPGGAEWWRPVLGVVVVIGIVSSVRRYRRLHRSRVCEGEPTTALYLRLRRIIQKWLRLEIGTGQTAAEFAAVAAARIRCADDPSLPQDTVEVYYRARFGSKAVSSAERTGLSQRLDRCEAELARRNGN